MEPPDEFRRLDVDGVLVSKRPALDTEDEAERLDVAGQFREREGDGLPLVEIVKLEGLEVAHEDVARAVALGQRVEILPGLSVRPAEIAPGALLLDDQDARPEQVDEPRTVVELGDMLLVAGDGLAADIEDLEEVVVEALRLALLVGRVPPLLREGRGAHADLVPRQAHQATPTPYWSRDSRPKAECQRPPERYRGPWRYRGTASRARMSSRHPRSLRTCASS